MENLIKGLVIFIGSLMLISILAILMAWPTQYLWNTCLVHAIDGINPIGFWQALGINFLFSILFKNSSTNKSSNNDK